MKSETDFVACLQMYRAWIVFSFIVSKCDVMFCWLKFLCSSLFVSYRSMAITLCPRVSNGTGIFLQSENLSFVTCTIKFMISLTTYFDTLKTILSSYFYFLLSISIEICIKYMLCVECIFVAGICFVYIMLYAGSAVHKCVECAVYSLFMCNN